MNSGAEELQGGCSGQQEGGGINQTQQDGQVQHRHGPFFPEPWTPLASPVGLDAGEDQSQQHQQGAEDHGDGQHQQGRIQGGCHSGGIRS